jgi:long-chain fatty acid transport protein
MKKVIFSLLTFFMLAFSASAQMDNLANMSAKWIRSCVRNASLDGSADMVNYNPAGLAMLDDGIYFSLSNQTLFRHPEHSFNLGAGEVSYEQDGNDPFLPMFYAAYKKNNFAVSTGVYVTGGGATVNYSSGSINTTLLGYSALSQYNAAILSGYGLSSAYTSLADQYLDASSYYLAIPLNFSYKVNDNLSFSVGGRYVRGINNTEAGLTLVANSNYSAYGIVDQELGVDYKSNANGFGGIIGVDYKASDKLNISVHYETKVKLEFEKDGDYSLLGSDAKSNRDLPAVLYTGIKYNISDKLSAEADFNYYFQTGADWGESSVEYTDSEGNTSTVDLSDAAGNCYTANLGFTYFLNEKLELSAGCSYTAFNYDNMELYYTEMGLYEALKYNNLTVGLGGGYNVTDNIQIDLGIGRTFWKDKTINSLSGEIPVDVTDKAYVLAIGVDLKF